MTFQCERIKGVDEISLPEDRGHPTHYRCRGCLSTFPVIGDTDLWDCLGAWWREEHESAVYHDSEGNSAPLDEVLSS